MLFAKQGFDGTTVRDLAEKAGVNVSQVSYYFGGKDGLYRACIEQLGQNRLAACSRMLQTVESAEELRVRLKMVLEEVISFQLEEPELTTIVFREVESGLPVAKDIFEQTFLRIIMNLREFFVSAQKAGIIRDDVDAWHISATIQGTLNYFIRFDPVRSQYVKASIKDPVYREKAIDDILRIVLQGVLKA